jgi:tetratricopeptide (TPR) repeat protein
MVFINKRFLEVMTKGNLFPQKRFLIGCPRRGPAGGNRMIDFGVEGEYNSSIVNRRVRMKKCFVLSVMLSVVSLCFGGTFFTPASAPETVYDIHCKVDEKGNFDETIRITLKNTAAQALDYIAFDWDETGDKKFTVTVNRVPLKKVGGFEVKDAKPVIFRLPSPLKQGDRVVLDVKATALFDFRESLEKSGDYALTHWFPRLWWDYKTHADYHVKLELPAPYVVTTSGRRDARSGVWIGKNIRSFAIVFGKKGKLNLLRDEIDGVQVRVLYPAGEKAAACSKVLMTTAKDVVHFYIGRFGFYPAKVISIVPGAPFPWGGYPMASNVVVVHGMQTYPKRGELHWKWITAHEIGHQYFLEWVLEKESHFWLMIGLGIYADREWMYGRELGNSKHENFIKRYVRGVNKRYNTGAVIHPDRRRLVDFDFNNVVEHGKGYSIIAALDLVLGKETFDKVYRRLLKEYKGRELGTADFQRVCEEVSGQNLNWFFDQWVYSSRYLSYSVTSKDSKAAAGSNGKYISTITVVNKGDLDMPVPVRVNFKDGSHRRVFTNRFLKVNRLTFESTSPLDTVKIDPGGVLANVVPPPEMGADDLTLKIKALNWSGEEEKAKMLLKKAIGLEYKRAREWAKLGLNLYGGKYDDEALTAFQHATRCSAAKSTWKMVGWVWQGHIHDLKGEREKAVSCYKEALKHETGQQMQHGQFNMTIDRKWVEKRLKEPFKR